MTVWQYLSSLPVGIAYGVLFLAGLGLVGAVWLCTYALYRGGKIKFGKAELDAPEMEIAEEKTPEAKP